MRVRLPWISAVRRSALLSFLILTACFAALAPNLQAQATAHFSFAQSTIGSTSLVPAGVAVDGSGNVYISDYTTGNVLKETLSGGSYTESVVVDGSSQGLYQPFSVAVDGSGNLYIADTSNNRVLKETLSAGSYTQTVIADTNSGIEAPRGVAVDGSGNVYIADACCYPAPSVLKETPSGGAYTQSTIGTGWGQPGSIAVDSNGNVYVADSELGQVVEEKLSAGSYTQTTAVSGLNSPFGVAVDSSGNLFITTNPMGGTDQLLKETYSGGAYTQTVITSDLLYPNSVAVDGNGNVYVADTGVGLLLKLALNAVDFGSVPVGASSNVISLTFTFDSAGTIGGPAVLTMGAPSLDFSDAGSGTCTFTASNNFPVSAGGTCTVDARFSPKQAGTRNGAVVLATSGGTTIATGYVYGQGEGPQVAFSPGTQSVAESGVTGVQNVAVDGSGNIFTNAPTSVLLNKATPIGSFGQAAAMAVDGSGNLYVVDLGSSPFSLSKETRQFDGSYVQSQITAKPFAIDGVAVDGSGNLYITVRTGSVYKETLNADGSYIETQLPISTLGSEPQGIAVDQSGNLYIADETNQKVLKETPSASGYTESVVADSSSSPYAISDPTDVAVDGNGNVYILDKAAGRAIKETPSGSTYVQTLIADTSAAYGLVSPYGLALDNAANVYIADNNLAEVVEEDVTDPPTLNFGSVNDGNASSAISVEIVNNGNQTLSAITPGLVVAGSTNMSDFIQASGGGTPADCTGSFSLAPGSACNLSIEFTPATSDSGSIGGTATLTDNNLNASPSATQTITLTGTAQSAGVAPSFTSGASTTFTVGQSGSFTVTATGTPTPTFTESGTLPTGVTLSTSGILSGVPSAGTAGSYPITITASNGVSPNATQGFTLTVDQAPAFTSGTGTTFTVGTAGLFTVTTTGYPTLSLSESGALPSGVSFVDNGNGTGTLAGTPAAGTGGAYSIIITAKNGVGSNATQNFTLTVDQALAINSASSTTFTVGTAGSFTVTSIGYPTSSLSESGALPSGVSFVDNGNGTGTLAGTPAAGTGGAYSITITAKNGVGSNATQNFTLTVDQAPAITSGTGTTFTVGTAGSFTVTSSGYPTPTITESGTLPAGVTLSTAGILSGTPASGTAGSYPITITASNGVSPNATENFTLTVQNAAGTITLSPASMPAGTVGSSYRQTVTASGGKAPYRYTVSAGTLPSGLSLTTAGVLSGLPVANGTFGFTIKATDAKGTTGSQAYTLVINPPVILLSPNTLPAGTVDKSYRQTLTASGGIAPYTYTVSGGNLPSGLSLTRAGGLSGTPTASGTFNFTIQATDSKGFTGSQAYTLAISPPTITLSPASLPAGTVGKSYRQTLTASGGIAPYTYTISKGALPSGLSLTKVGVLSGTPTVSGTFTFTITATDSSTGGPYTGLQSYSLVVNKARP